MDLNVKYRDFVLDKYQIQAITELENGHSLVLSAPTGSGKTLVAEYLIEQVLKTDRRIIYTSPIKALSNQKYRDFSTLYGDKVGILTGDVVINRDAQALIVTTEVYRNMAIEDPQAIEDVSYVVFDEIHYLGDIERGTVWEESIIFSPKSMRFLALSATIPNCDELARWIESVIDHQVKVIHHQKRAVPLAFQFYYKKHIMNFKELRKRAKNQSEKDFRGRKRRFNKKENEFRYLDILKQLKSQDKLPLLYFVFSRALADRLAHDTARRLDMTTPAQKDRIETMVDNCIEKYQLHNLETAQKMKEELMKGVGRHHAGLLPQLKELVEILFAERILKVLYVTETFAVGVNMPARSVAYDALRKYDGRSFRPMHALEFCQISGRAGRRGIDKFGWVIVPHEPRDLSVSELKDLVYGDIEPLISQFDLSFNSVLNLYSGHKSEEVRTILKRNFAQFQANKKLPFLMDKVNKIRADIEKVQPRCPEKKNDLDEFMKFQKRRKQILNKMARDLNSTQGGLYGKKGRRYKKEMEQHLSGTHKELKIEEKEFICGNCKNKSKCVSRYYQAARLTKKLNYWREKLEEQQELQLPLYENKLETLRQLGYIDDNGLLARGEIASRIHTEEITVTELYFQGYFHECTPEEINAICLGLVYEHRRRGSNGDEKRPRAKIPEKVRSARGFVNSLVRQHPFIKPLDVRLSHIMTAWCDGQDFEDIMKHCEIPEGDLIRIFRQVIDLLRQMRDAIKDQSLRSKLLTCLDMLNRDIVLATELRD
jgi:superfamily II RNA helicase